MKITSYVALSKLFVPAQGLAVANIGARDRASPPNFRNVLTFSALKFFYTVKISRRNSTRSINGQRFVQQGHEFGPASGLSCLCCLCATAPNQLFLALKVVRQGTDGSPPVSEVVSLGDAEAGQDVGYGSPLDVGLVKEPRRGRL